MVRIAGRSVGSDAKIEFIDEYGVAVDETVLLSSLIRTRFLAGSSAAAEFMVRINSVCCVWVCCVCDDVCAVCYVCCVRSE